MLMGCDPSFDSTLKQVAFKNQQRANTKQNFIP